MANRSPTAQRYYAVHRLIEAASNYPTFYIHHIADMLIGNQAEEPENGSNDGPNELSLPVLKLGYDRTNSESHHTVSPKPTNTALPLRTELM